MLLTLPSPKRICARYDVRLVLLVVLALLSLRVYLENITCEGYRVLSSSLGIHLVAIGFITPQFATKLTQIGASEDLESEQSGCMGAKRNTLFADMRNITITPHQLELELQRSKKCGSTNFGSNHWSKSRGGACAPGGVLEVLGAAGQGSGVPRVFHQSYMTHQLPADLLPYVRSWHGYLAKQGWRRVWWTDADNHWLVHTHYPQWAAAWDKLYHPIERADTARYFYMHRYGGLYADVDMAYFERRCGSIPGVNRRHEPPPEDPFEAGVPFPYDLHDFFAAHAGDGVHMFKQCNSNSLMASEAGHQFWLTVFAAWAAAAAAQGATHQIGHVSGIYMLRSACEVATEGTAVPDNSTLQPRPSNSTGSGKYATPGLRRLAVTRSDAAAAHAARVTWAKVASSREGGQGGGADEGSSQSVAEVKPVGTPELLWCMVHHQTNSWRWKARRDDALRLLDSGLLGFAGVVVLVGVYNVFSGGLPLLQRAAKSVHFQRRRAT